MGGPDPKPHSMYCRGCSVCRPGHTWPTRIAALLLLLLCACTTTHLPEPTKPVKVEITAMPVREVTCWMPEIPKAPELEAMDFEDSDVISRTMIHRYQYSEMVQFALEMQQWAEEVQKRVNTMRGVEP